MLSVALEKKKGKERKDNNISIWPPISSNKCKAWQMVTKEMSNAKSDKDKTIIVLDQVKESGASILLTKSQCPIVIIGIKATKNPV